MLDGGARPEDVGLEVAQVAGMLVALAPEDANGDQEFTCQHFDGARCRIYETRPNMCRRYGVLERCPRAECGINDLMDRARACA